MKPIKKAGKKVEKKPYLQITQKTIFTFAHIENAERLAVALIRGGFFAKLSVSSGAYLVIVYETYYP